MAGENANIHDHWVDEIAHDVIWDFNRAEGDRILIEGHTTEIASITHGDSNGDGVIDHSKIWLYSDQGGGGGAHNDDLLGDITVYGDLITEADITHTAKPAYGIVRDINGLAEALTPTTIDPDTGPIPAPDSAAAAADPTLTAGANVVFGIAGTVGFNDKRGTEMAIEHTEALALSEGTISFSFLSNELDGRDALFSKDARGYVDGGHMTAYTERDGDFVTRFQTDSGQITLKADKAVSVGAEHDIAITFGDDGAHLYFDGVKVDSEASFTQDWTTNQEMLLIGANGWRSLTGEIGRPSDQFNGDITDFAILDQQLGDDAISAIAASTDGLWL